MKKKTQRIIVIVVTAALLLTVLLPALSVLAYGTVTKSDIQGIKKDAQNHQAGAGDNQFACKPNIPALNINLQIHISSDASPEQIEKIFESMSKYIYKDR